MNNNELPSDLDKQLASELLNALAPILKNLPSESRVEAGTWLMSFGWEVCRGIEGDDFVRLWASQALDGLNEVLPTFSFNKMN